MDAKFQICIKEFIGKFIHVNNCFQISQKLFQDGQKYYKLFDKFIKSFYVMNKFLINCFEFVKYFFMLDIPSGCKV